MNNFPLPNRKYSVQILTRRTFGRFGCSATFQILKHGKPAKDYPGERSAFYDDRHCDDRHLAAALGLKYSRTQ
jgi:hypothetical protein